MEGGGGGGGGGELPVAPLVIITIRKDFTYCRILCQK